MSLAKNPPRIGSKCVDMLNPDASGEVVSIGGSIVRLKSDDGRFFNVPIERIQRKRCEREISDDVLKACKVAEISRGKLARLAKANGLTIEQAAGAILE